MGPAYEEGVAPGDPGHCFFSGWPLEHGHKLGEGGKGGKDFSTRVP